MSAVIAGSGVAAGRLLARGATKLNRTQFLSLRKPQPSLRRTFALGTRLQEKKYTQDHEWVEIDNGIATVGISNFAANALGDVVYVELPTIDPDVTVGQGDTIGAVESVKSASDILSPISGTVTETNETLESEPAKINKSPEGDGWLAKIKVSDESELGNLMSAEEYKKFTEDAAEH